MKTAVLSRTRVFLSYAPLTYLDRRGYPPNDCASLAPSGVGDSNLVGEGNVRIMLASKPKTKSIKDIHEIGDIIFVKKDDLDITRSPVSPAQLGEIIDLIKDGEINGKIAKELFEIVYIEGGPPSKIVNERGMKQVTDTGAIEKAVIEIIAANPDQVEKAKVNPKLVGWFVGQVMKAAGGKANPKKVNEFVSAKLNS